MTRNSTQVRPSVIQIILALVAATLLLVPSHASERLSLSMQDAELSEVMQMLSRQQRVNILLTGDVGGQVSFSLYDIELDQAIRAIAAAAGFAVEHRDGNYFIVKHEEAGKYAPDGITTVRSFEVRYADASILEQTLRPYLSDYGALTMAPDRRLLIVEDTPEFVTRIATLFEELDRKPTQVLIEAKILEVTLDDEDAFGLDWTKLFNSDGGGGAFGTSGLSQAGAAGFFFDFATPNVEATLNALSARGRVRTLSTPKLLTLQNQQASVIIGDRRGYQTTTTINQVTTESIEFLESGVILRVTPTVDHQGNVMLDIHPEVSNGTVDANGIPSQTTTEVTTQLIVPDGQTIFIGGLMKHTLSEVTSGVPVLGGLPGVGRLFSNTEQSNVNTETVVLITPYVMNNADNAMNKEHIRRVESHDQTLIDQQRSMHKQVNKRFKKTQVDLSRYQSLKMSSPSLTQSSLSQVTSTESNDYTLYLFHCYSENDAKHFVNASSSDAKLSYYPSDEGRRYAVVYGSYRDAKDAEFALKSLPSQLASLKPTVRTVSSLLSSGG